MTREEFEIYAARTKLEDESRAMARLHLLDGVHPEEVARRFGRRLTAVRSAINRILTEHRKAGGCPPDWLIFSELVPPALAIEFREKLAAARKAAGLAV